MAQSATRSRTPRTAAAGFSMVELVVSICVMLILTAIAIPSLMRSLRTYQLNDAAARLADMLKFTRFEAVRLNTQINLQVTQPAAGWVVWTDTFNNGNSGPIDPRDKQLLIAGFATLLPPGGSPGPPPPTAITTKLGVSSLKPLSGSNSSVAFDARGAIRDTINGPVSSKVYVLYIGSTNDPDPGYRAVVLLPSGSTQIWTAPSNGPWQRVN